MTKQQLKQKGFTIIEVVLVLAIAAIIMLMVFIAWPALQRNQRDQSRRDAVARVVSQLAQYQTNNNGAVPSAQLELNANGKFYNYVVPSGDTDSFSDPKTGNVYTMSLVPNTTTAVPADGVIQYAVRATCNGESFQAGTGARQAAVRVKLEASGVFCQDNS